MDFSLCSPHFPTNPGSSSTPTSAYVPSIAKTLRCQKGHDTGGTAVDPTPAVHQDAIVRLLRQGSVDDAKCHLYNLMGPIWRQIHVYVCVLCIYIYIMYFMYIHTYIDSGKCIPLYTYTCTFFMRDLTQATWRIQPSRVDFWVSKWEMGPIIWSKKIWETRGIGDTLFSDKANSPTCAEKFSQR